MAKYRILSLDGGGSWALIQVRALIELFDPDISGHQILSNFSYVAANSGGSIVLAALLEGLTLNQILDLFLSEDNRRTIFVEFNAADVLKYKLEHLITGGPRYYAAKKLLGLQKLLPHSGNKTLPDARAAVQASVGRCPHFLITSFDYDRLRSIYLRSDANSKTANSSDPEPTTLAEAVHAASNAPIKYFDLPAEINVFKGTRRCWDGALAGCNNPSLAALTEVLANQYHLPPAANSPADIQLLSLGTANVRLPMQDGTIPHGLATEKVSPSLLHNINRVTTCILDDPPDAATFTAYTMLGGFNLPVSQSPLVRMNPMIQPLLNQKTWTRPIGLDKIGNVDPFLDLVNLDMDAIKPDQVDLIVRLADAWILGNVINQPIRADNALQSQLGQNTFLDARNAWLTKITADPQVC